ncbi:RDD family protein [Lysobacter sp. FW306-1B-D06B]|uniref:RDD family protein n=1 Tax=Lysobacter sp. FW306-1B-D06B TaxID=3140250 RepID=UPI0031406B9F
MTDWYYHLPGQGRVGPLDADDVREAYRDGRVQRDTLAWHVGARDWQPLDRFSETLGLDAVAPPVMAPQVPATPAATAFESVDRASPYAPPRATLSEAGDYLGDAGEVVYAGFWKRLAALMIDALVVTIAYYIALFAGLIAFGVGASGLFSGNPSGSPGTIALLMAVIYLAYPVISGLYYIGMESSSTQATLGKMAVGIKVADDAGRRLAPGRALGRWAAHLLCYLTLYIGYIMAAFTQRKRGLHDMVAGTLVVDRWAYTAHPERQQRGLGVVAIVVLILGALATLAYIGIVAAIALPAYQDYVNRAAGVG